MAEIVKINVDTRQEVYEKDLKPPIAGFNTPEEFLDQPLPGWRFDERRWPAFEEEQLIEALPNIWDPQTLGLQEEEFQSGIGDNRDLEVLRIANLQSQGQNLWVPEVNHGFYYIHEEPRYLYSDQSTVEFVTDANIVDGHMEVQLRFNPKPGIPISIFQLNKDSVSNIIPESGLRKRVNFTGKIVNGVELSTRNSNNTINFANVDTTKDEFVIDYGTVPPTLILNKVYTDSVGEVPVFYSDLISTEKLGTSNGHPNQSFQASKVPFVVGSARVFVGDSSNSTFVEWTEVENFNTSGPLDNHFIVDPDIGRIAFGDGTNGKLLSLLLDVYVIYDQGIWIEYEPENTIDSVLPAEADLNPVHRSLERGFIYLSERRIDVANITLETDKPIILGTIDIYGPVFVGNDFARLEATVRTSTGEPVENVEVIFDMNNLPFTGTISGSSEQISRFTNSQGVARAFFNPPRATSDLGFFTTQIESQVLPNDTLVLAGAGSSIDANTSDIYVFTVRNDDPWLGKVHANSDTENDPLETTRRIVNQLPFETEFRLETGKKVVLYHYDPLATNPNTGDPGAFIPTQPVEIVGNKLRFNLSLPDISNPIAGYWVVAPRKVSIFAQVTNKDLNQTFVSNLITFQVSVPPFQLGVFVANPPGVNINNDEDGTFPFDNLVKYGWRLRSDGLNDTRNLPNPGSALNGITFLNINPVADGPFGGLYHFFNVQNNTQNTGQCGHVFKVI